MEERGAASLAVGKQCCGLRFLSSKWKWVRIGFTILLSSVISSFAIPILQNLQSDDVPANDANIAVYLYINGSQMLVSIVQYLLSQFLCTMQAELAGENIRSQTLLQRVKLSYFQHNLANVFSGSAVLVGMNIAMYVMRRFVDADNVGNRIAQLYYGLLVCLVHIGVRVSTFLVLLGYHHFFKKILIGPMHSTHTNSEFTGPVQHGTSNHIENTSSPGRVQQRANILRRVQTQGTLVVTDVAEMLEQAVVEAQRMQAGQMPNLINAATASTLYTSSTSLDLSKRKLSSSPSTTAHHQVLDEHVIDLVSPVLDKK